MQMESLSWCLGRLGPVRRLGSTLRFPDGEEWYAFGLTTNRWYRQMFLLIAMLQTLSGEPQVVLPDGRRWDLTAPLTGLC
ncbi:MAG: hypothetical protein UF305_05125 [Oscillospiraceae bacterium]|nr:hypothetical protein [Oscillospiraceae bacterium]